MSLSGDIQNYRDSRLPSYSLLSKLDSGQLAYVRDYMGNQDLSEYEKKPSKARIIGSYVDSILFESEKYLTDNYYVIDSDFSEGLYTTFVDALIEDIMESDILKDIVPSDSSQMSHFVEIIKSQHPSSIDKAYATAGFKISIVSVIKKIQKDYLQYMFEKLAAYGKTILTLSDAATGDTTAKALREGKYTSMYFESTAPDVELITQLPIRVNFCRPNVDYDTLVKILPDIIEIDHTKKFIRGVDVKTREGSAYYFRFDFFKWKYYLQASFYTRILGDWLAGKQYAGQYKGYKINNNFRFLVGSKDYFNSCIFECSDADIKAGLGGFDRKDGTHVKGVYELLNNLNWHVNSGNWNSPFDVVECDGVLKLDLLDKL